MKILLLIIILLIILVLCYPLRIRVTADWQEQGNVAVFWLPLPGFDWCVRVWRHDLPKQQSAASAAGAIIGEVVDWEKLKEKAANKKSDNKPEIKKPKKRKLNIDWRSLAEKAAGSLHVQRFDVRASLGGDPALAAFLGGSVWAALSFAFGVFSCYAAEWCADGKLLFDLVPDSISKFSADVQIWLRVGSLLLIGLCLLGMYVRAWVRERIFCGRPV
jgi:hypothetical protein